MTHSVNGTLHNNTLCHYAECHYADCQDLYFVMLNVMMLSVVMLNVIMLSVMAPNMSPNNRLSKCPVEQVVPYCMNMRKKKIHWSCHSYHTYSQVDLSLIGSPIVSPRAYAVKLLSDYIVRTNVVRAPI
jgi:hypothetical protein